MCNGSPAAAPKAHEFFRQKSNILRQNSNVSVASDSSMGQRKPKGATLERTSVGTASRPWSAVQTATRPLSAQKSIRRPISAPRLIHGGSAYDQQLSRFQDTWVDRREHAAPKRKKPRDPFKDFLADDPRMAQLMVERTIEDAHIRSCKSDLHHKMILGKLDAGPTSLEHDLHLNVPHVGNVSKSESALPPVAGLHKLQQSMIQSHKNLCESTPEAISSFIDNEKRRKQKEKQEKNKHDTSKKFERKASLKEFKTMLKAAQNPRHKTLELWNTAGAVGFRNRYRKHHEQCLLETLDVAQAVQMYKDGQPLSYGVCT